MKKFTKFLSLMLVDIMAMGCLSACGKGGSKDNTGVYKLLSMSSESEGNYTEAQVKQLEEAGLAMYIELKKDKKVSLFMYEYEQTGTCDDKEITIDGDSAEYTVKDGKLTVSVQGMEMKFKKSSMDEINKIKDNAQK